VPTAGFEPPGNSEVPRLKSQGGHRRPGKLGRSGSTFKRAARGRFPARDLYARSWTPWPPCRTAGPAAGHTQGHCIVVNSAATSGDAD
jgi:hypothetical protein